MNQSQENMEMENDIALNDAVSLLRKGIAAAKASNRVVARNLLLQALQLDPACELAWLWLAWQADSPKEAALYLEKVLEINPNNEQAQQWLQKIGQRKTPDLPNWQCFLCGVTLQEKVNKCPKCRSLLDLSDIDALINNNDADRSMIQLAIERMENLLLDDAIKNSTQEGDINFTIHFNLGIAYLNAKRFDEAIVHLSEASRLKQQDNVLRAQVHVLIRQVLAVKERSRERQNEKIIMIIDDSPTVRKLVAVTLERHGYKVVAAPDGVQALAKLEEVTPDLILLDITMPYMDGYQICKLLRSNNNIKAVPVLMLSGKDGLIDRMRARLAGASGHISKPVEPNVLLATLQKYLKTANQR